MWNVLVVDDYPAARDIFKEFFNSFPNFFKVVGEASNGEEAVKLAAAKKPDFIVMDITMPLMDGLTAARKIKKELGLPSIVLTYSGYSKEKLKDMARGVGVREHFVKPLNLMDLMDRMVNEYSLELKANLKKAI